jgi:hypothetical protein
MSILLVYTDANTSFNPFVKTLKDGLESVGCNIDWGLHRFWVDYDNYDIFHFQWPESVFEFKPVSDQEIDKLLLHIFKLKEKKKKIVYTRHNDKPHYSSDRNRLKLYEIIENNSDAILHMSNYSIEQFKKQNSNNNIKHFIIPHHTYDEIYPSCPKKDIARKFLKISNKKFIFLCFGGFRDDEERDLVINSFKELNYPNKYLIAPRFYKHKIDFKYLSTHTVSPKAIFSFIKERLKYISLFRISDLSSEMVGHKELPFYFSASDVVFIQRCQILNSGNLPMGFHFKKVVVGPNIGNVGEILQNTNNPVFDPRNQKSVTEALSTSIKKADANLGIKNKEFASLYYKTNKIAKDIKVVYESILK